MKIKDITTGWNYHINTSYAPVFEDIKRFMCDLKGFSPGQLDIIEAIVYCSQDFILDVLKTNPLFLGAFKKLKAKEYFILHSILFSYYWLYFHDTFKETFSIAINNLSKDLSNAPFNNKIIEQQHLKEILAKNPKIVFEPIEPVISKLTGLAVLKNIQLILFKQKYIENIEEIISRYQNYSKNDFLYTLYCDFSEICGYKPIEFKNEKVKMFCAKFILKSKDFQESFIRNAFNDYYLYFKNLTD